MPASQIDFSALTQVVHFSLVPNPDGSLNSNANGLSSANSADLISHAHAAGKKVLVCVGGASSQTGFRGATTSTNRAAFISNLVNFVSTRGYDGVDIDWEPLEPLDTPQYTNLIHGLRAALNAVAPRPLLTAAVAPPPTPTSLLASLQNQFDQINLMTYDLSGPYTGWVTWFNAPLYDGGYHFASTGSLVPSADGMVNACIAAGVAPGKLGIGIAFYGWLWSGGSGTSTGGAALPRQNWTTAPIATQPTYNTIISTYYQTNLYHWDTIAQSAYLSIDGVGSSNDRFISYDDQRTCQSKVSYARNRGLGGVMIWQLAQDHLPNQPDPLLQAVKQAMATPGKTTIQRNGDDVNLTFTTCPLGSYRIQWNSNLTTGFWNTLIITNDTGIGGMMRVTDPAPISQSPRFFRIQTPP
ncbi:MAG: chitinase [Pedosphaera sp.]|nr:chitinase [Pedosphaera sp.]